MREIKFRAKARVDGKWKYGSLITYSDSSVAIHSEEDGKTWPCDDESVGQYTGLPDKHGTEIYEGDLIKFGPPRKSFIPLEKATHVDKVIYAYGGFNVSGDGLGEVTDWHECEVIGNIWENPELLKPPFFDMDGEER